MHKYWPSLILVALALLLNERLLGHFLSASGEIQTLKTRGLVLAFEVLLLGLAFFLSQLEESKSKKLMKWAGIYLLVTPLLIEASIRALIGFGFSPLRQPILYFPVTSDAYWAQLDKWGVMTAEEGTASNSAEKSWQKKVPDSILGWTYAGANENPLGARTDRELPLSALKNPVLFFGDSFMHGTEDFASSIPALTEEIIGGLRGKTDSCVNLAMGGYGLDQILLKIRETRSKIQSDRLVVGILMDDLDRTVLSYRIRPKPFFSLDNNKLQLHTEHLALGKSYLNGINTSVPSYALRILSHRLPTHPFSLPEKEEEIRTLSRKMITEVATELHHAKSSLVVLFYEQGRLNYTDWREGFLKLALLEEKLTVLDTKPLFLKSPEGMSGMVNSFYLPTDGHLSRKGSEKVAAAIAEWTQRDTSHILGSP